MNIKLDPIIFVITTAILIGIVVLLVLGWLAMRPSWLHYFLHKDTFKSIVQRITSNPPPANGVYKVYDKNFFANDNEILSLTKHVNAFLKPSGALVISFITKDDHHAGIFGYVYDSEEETNHPQIEFPEWENYSCVAPHWWAASAYP